jgi:hypothetical protein
VRELTAVQHDLLQQLGPSRMQASLSFDDAPAFSQPPDDSGMLHQSQGSCEQEYQGALSPQSLEVSSCFPHQARARLRQGNSCLLAWLLMHGRAKAAGMPLCYLSDQPSSCLFSTVTRTRQEVTAIAHAATTPHRRRVAAGGVAMGASAHGRQGVTRLCGGDARGQAPSGSESPRRVVYEASSGRGHEVGGAVAGSRGGCCAGAKGGAGKDSVGKDSVGRVVARLEGLRSERDALARLIRQGHDDLARLRSPSLAPSFSAVLHRVWGMPMLQRPPTANSGRQLTGALGPCPPAPPLAP